MNDRDFADFVATRDVPCPRCRYNLRGVDHPRCPECGMRLSLTVIPRWSPTAPWLLAIIASGIIASTTPDTVRILIRNHDRLPWWYERSMFIHYQALTFLFVFIVLLFNRYRFGRLPGWLQWTVAFIFMAFALVHGAIRWNWVAW